MSSLTADITDTNFLLDDLLHQLALHSDYSLLKSIKAAYTDIHHTRQTQQAAVKAAIQQLTANIDGLEEGVRSVRVTEVKAWKEGVKGSVREAEDEVEGLKWEEARLTAAVAVKEEEGRLLEQRRVDKLRRHAERMQSHKKCLRLYSILSAVRFDAVDDAVIRGTYHGLDSVQRSFTYSLDEEGHAEGATAFDATNRLWEQLWSPDAHEPFQHSVDSITQHLDRLTFQQQR